MSLLHLLQHLCAQNTLFVHKLLRHNKLCARNPRFMRKLTGNKKASRETQKAFLRFLADSNRRTRFCRPLTKPLIQGTLFGDWIAKIQ